MPVSSTPCAILSPRLAALEQHLPAAIGGGVHPVHQARVASRRLREALPVFGMPAGRRHLGRATRQVRRVTQALGPVRELDVTLELLETVAQADGALRPPARLVARLVAGERRRRRTALLAMLGPAEAQRAVDAVAAVVARLAKIEDTGGWRAVLAGRASTRAERLIERIYDVGLLFDPGRLHEVRIAAKKLRYALEIVAEARLAPAGRLVSALKKSQEQLGHLHDLQIVLLFARAAEIDAASRARGPLALLREHLERACHREHARYLRRRARLLSVCEAVPGLLARSDAASRVPVGQGRPGPHHVKEVPS